MANQLNRKEGWDMRLRLLVVSMLLFSVVAPVLSQDSIVIIYDTAITPRHVKHFNVPVTYYDFHIDGSNPDFGIKVTSRWDRSGLPLENLKGWVDSTLTAEKTIKRSPALVDTFFNISWNLEELFKPWVLGAVDTFVWKMEDSIVDIYDTAGWLIDSDTFPRPDTLMISDTLYKNVVIKDSLPATWIANTTTFEDTTDSMWIFGSKEKVYPLFGKGFSDELDPDNTGYTMSFHNKFTYRGGEILTLGADDDCYAYINGKLVIDGGGFHSLITQDLSLDSLNLTVGEKCELDIFYVERRMGGGIYFTGISNFDTLGAVRTDTLSDTLITERVGVISPSKKSMVQKRTVLGLRVPPSSRNVRLEYFSVSGAKLLKREMPLSQALASQPANLPQGMYMVRVTFLNAHGNRISAGSSRTTIVHK
jgi:fibro-slime domain-containing protein